jgi:hypothetical protein
MTQTIQLDNINKCFIIENTDNILFVDIMIIEHQIKIKLINKSKIGNEQSIDLKTE